jgi:hypothetical protein
MLHANNPKVTVPVLLLSLACCAVVDVNAPCCTLQSTDTCAHLVIMCSSDPTDLSALIPALLDPKLEGGANQ